VRFQLHAEDRRCMRLHISRRLGDFDATALAAPAGMDLCLDHPDTAAQFGRRADRFIHRETRDAARRGHAILAQDFFCLIFVDFHV
jgi:hypothetical protein